MFQHNGPWSKSGGCRLGSARGGRGGGGLDTRALPPRLPILHLTQGPGCMAAAGVRDAARRPRIQSPLRVSRAVRARGVWPRGALFRHRLTRRWPSKGHQPTPTPSEDRGSSSNPPRLVPSPKLAHLKEETLENIQGGKDNWHPSQVMTKAPRGQRAGFPPQPEANSTSRTGLSATRWSTSVTCGPPAGSSDSHTHTHTPEVTCLGYLSASDTRAMRP